MAVYPKPHLSLNPLEHRRFPYLLRGWTFAAQSGLEHRHHLYPAAGRIRLSGGGHRLVQSLRAGLGVVHDAGGGLLRGSGRAGFADAAPEIFNTDQGVQFTSAAFQAPLLAAQVKLSMDGRGRVFDNIFVERLWRSVKYQEVFLHDYENVAQSRCGLGRYFPFQYLVS